jgi:tetratricopeptide (TPR) repeat protein
MSALTCRSFSNFCQDLDVGKVSAMCCRLAVYYDLGKYEQAIQDFSKAIEVAPGLETLYFNRGSVYYHLGKYTQVIQDSSKAIELTPPSVTIMVRQLQPII